MTDARSERPVREQRFERRMSDAEALMWNVEKDPWLNPSGGSLIILDRPPDIDHFRKQLAATVADVPRLREHVVGGLGRFSPPVWRPDSEFDIDHHIRQVALPAPGSMRQLLDMVAQIYQDPYDRTRPLWMYYVIEGLQDGRAGMVWKIHHTVADGTGAARLSEAFIQLTRETNEPPTVDLDALVAAAVAEDAATNGNPTVLETLLGTATHLVRRQAGIARRLAGEMAMLGADPLRARDAANSVGRTIGQIRSQLGGEDRPAASDAADVAGAPPALPGGSPLWRERSRHRYLEVMSFSLDDALASAKLLGGSLNDWFLTGVVNGAVAYHDERGVPLRSLNTSFVVSTRADKAIGGNSFTPSRFSAPAGPMEPAARFAALSQAMSAKRSQVSGGGLLAGLAGVANLLPTSLVTSVARSQAAKMDFATSNLRGPKRRFYISGARVDESYAFGPLAGTAFNLTAMSYAGRFGISLFMDPVAIEDPTGLRDHVHAAYQELIDLPAAVPQRRRRSS
ncbi:MAG: wax ester/triacylglycerol synthase domain-containing protein [Ilumatobacteraceae bacterium]